MSSKGDAPLRICMAAPHLAPYTKTNGIAWYNRWLAEGLATRGHSVTILDVSLLRRPPATEPWDETVVMAPGKSRVPRSLRSTIFVRNYLASNRRFDIFETSNWPGLAALRPRDMAVTFVRLITPSGRATVRHPQNFICNALEAISVHRADATIASTSYIQSSLSALYRVDLREAYRVPFGIPDVSTVKGAYRVGPVSFLSIGRAEMRKGSDVLLRALVRAFESSDDFVVTLAGAHGGFSETSPEMRSAWSLLTTKFSDRMTIIEDLSEERKLELLASADYLLMTSRTESFGLPVIEAMRAGTAVISSTGGGLREVAGASSGNVLYANPEDATQLVEAILNAVRRGRRDASERGRLARSTYVQQFHEDVFLDRTIEAYRDGLLRKMHRTARSRPF
jgi:glycosyltransferase involved in cell wall biosynthesis